MARTPRFPRPPQTADERAATERERHERFRRSLEAPDPEEDRRRYLEWESRDIERTRRLVEAVVNEDLADLGRRLLETDARSMLSMREHIDAQRRAGVPPWADLPDGDTRSEPNDGQPDHPPAPDGTD